MVSIQMQEEVINEFYNFEKFKSMNNGFFLWWFDDTDTIKLQLYAVVSAMYGVRTYKHS